MAESYLNSKTASKISDSNNDETKQFLVKAQNFLEQARIDLEAGKLYESVENTDQCIRAFSAAGAINSKSESKEELLTRKQVSKTKLLRITIFRWIADGHVLNL